MLPGSPEWGRAHDRHLQPPEYDGCEDCECEDPECAEMICRTCLADDDAHAPDEDCEKVACECECHNLPSEPDAYDLWIDRQFDDDREDY